MNSPSFNGQTELSRYIDPDERQGDNHAAVTAFMMSETDQSNPKKAYLSVNAIEIEVLSNIAEYYRSHLQGGVGEVAICVHKILKYVDAGKKSGLSVKISKKKSWVFDGPSGEEQAFKHRPVRLNKSGLSGSPSHCGVEFLRELDEVQQRNFARRLAKRPKFHLF